MSKMASLAGKGAGEHKAPKKPSSAGPSVVAHPKTKLRDIENLLRYVQWKDERRETD